jgi:hypothetical protein
MKRYVLVAVVALGCVGFLPAWWVKGHETVAKAAAARLPDEVPAFFRAGGKALAHYAGDPDRWKNKAATFLKASEAPNHFLDLEDLDGNELPLDRFKAIELCQRLKVKPDKVGLLPYAILENFDRLCCAFYDHRQDPENTAIRAKCLVYAGILCHYTGDTGMPLHTSRDYDGRRNAEGKLVQKGIHAKIDGFPEKNGFTPEEICRDIEAKKIDDVWKHTLAQIDESHKHVKRCYELDEAGAFDKPTEESRKFILERCKLSVQFTVDLWYTAWLRSKTFPAHY